MIQTKGHKGFTLIELLVVIAIIGVLASVVLASLNSARLKSRDARRIADIKQIQLALELYYDANNQSYPVGTYSAIVTGGSAALAPAYMPSVPNDPSTSATAPYVYQSLASNAASAAECAAAPCSSYVLRATMEQSGVALTNDNDESASGGVPECTDTAFHYCVRP